jgi:hypothetical protein
VPCLAVTEIGGGGKLWLHSITLPITIGSSVGTHGTLTLSPEYVLATDRLYGSVYSPRMYIGVMLYEVARRGCQEAAY